MGNAVSPCFNTRPVRRRKKGSGIKVVLWGGATRTLQGGPFAAGELMVEFPDQLVCHGGSFYIGQPVPALSIGDCLVPGETYFLIPADRLACRVLTAGSIAAIRPPQPPNSNGTRPPVDFVAGNPFVHVRTAEGEPLIRVSQEFIAKLLGGGGEESKDAEEGERSVLCSTPELKKHYEQLVVSTKVAPWSPKLDTISESKNRRIPTISFSPARLSPIRLSPIRTSHKKKQGFS